MQDWVITLIDSADTLKELRRRKELYCMFRLKTYDRTVLMKGVPIKRFKNKK